MDLVQCLLDIILIFSEFRRLPVKIAHLRNTTTALILAGFTLTGAACSQMASIPQNPQPAADGAAAQVDAAAAGFTQIPDLPIPPGATMNIERTFIVGSAESWYGQTMIDAPGSGNIIFDFYKQELPGYGWQELSSVRAQTSVLTYTRDSRVLAIQLTEQQLGSTDVMITVSPRGGSSGDLIQPVQ